MPKPVIPTNVLAPKSPCLVQTPCAKTAKSCAFCDCTPEFYGGILYWLLEKQGKLYFLQSSQTLRERRFGIEKAISCATALCQNPRIRRSRILGLFAGFRFAFDTGGLGLWLGAFGKTGLFMCQSVPGPLNLFCDTELGFNLFCDAELGFNLFCDAELCFCRLCNFDLPNKQRFSLQRHKNCKKLRFLWQYVL